VNVPSEKIIAYVDGELSETERAEFAAELAANDALRGRVERARGLRRRLSAAFDGALSEDVPARLTAAATAPPVGNVVALQPKRIAWSYREWGAMAASLIVGLLVGLGVIANQAAPFAQSAHGLVARGSLANALETQAAANTSGAVRIGVSFQAQDGGYCRTFTMAHAHLAGLACKHDNDWRVPMTAQYAPAAGEIRTAGADTPLPILQAVDQMIAGDPLDARAESAARDQHWRSRP
jgi:hypothetical protein